MPNPFTFLNLGKRALQRSVTRSTTERPVSRLNLGLTRATSPRELTRGPYSEERESQFIESVSEQIKAEFASRFGEVPQLHVLVGSRDTMPLLAIYSHNFRPHAEELGFKFLAAADIFGDIGDVFEFPTDPLVGAAKIGRRAFLEQ